MTHPDDAHDLDIEAVHSELSQGLETCRSMVSDYRAALIKNPRSKQDTERDTAVGETAGESPD